MAKLETKVKCLELRESYGKFEIEPLEPGFGTTIGNSLRRVLLSSIPGAAITSFKIDGVLHEFSTIPGVKEDVMEIMLNLKKLPIKIEDKAHGSKPVVIKLNMHGEGEVTAADIETPPGVKIVGPDAHIATLTDEKATLTMEMVVEIGKGYVPSEEISARADLPIGAIPMDAIFTPVRKTNFIVEPMRVGRRSNLERLMLEVWTNGAILPDDAVEKAAKLLLRHFQLFTEVPQEVIPEEEKEPREREVLTSKFIEEMDFSARTFNCLKREGINTLGEILEHTEDDLLAIQNFGRKSLAELKEKLAELGLALKEPSKESKRKSREKKGKQNAAQEDLSEAK